MYFVLLSCPQVLLNFSCKESCIFQYFVDEVLFSIEKHLACNFFLNLIEFTDISQHNRTLTLQCYTFYQTNVILTFKLKNAFCKSSMTGPPKGFSFNQLNFRSTETPESDKVFHCFIFYDLIICILSLNLTKMNITIHHLLY